MAMESAPGFEHAGEEERVFTPSDLIIPEQVWHQLLESGAISMDVEFDKEGNPEKIIVRNKATGEEVLRQNIKFFHEHSRINPNAFQDR